VTPDEFFEKWLKAWEDEVMLVNETKAVHQFFEAWRELAAREVLPVLEARRRWMEAQRALRQGHTRVSAGKAYAFPRPTTAPASDEPPIGRT